MTLTFTQTFTFNEPRIGSIEIDGPEMSREEILKQIETQFPEALDIELLNVEEDID